MGYIEHQWFTSYVARHMRREHEVGTGGLPTVIWAASTVMRTRRQILLESRRVRQLLCPLLRVHDDLA